MSKQRTQRGARNARKGAVEPSDFTASNGRYLIGLVLGLLGTATIAAAALLWSAGPLRDPDIRHGPPPAAPRLQRDERADRLAIEDDVRSRHRDGGRGALQRAAAAGWGPSS